jgi:hypothetical protein
MPAASRFVVTRAGKKARMCIEVSIMLLQGRVAAEANLKRDNTNVTGDDTDGVPGDHESRKKDDNRKEAKKIKK